MAGEKGPGASEHAEFKMGGNKGEEQPAVESQAVERPQSRDFGAEIGGAQTRKKEADAETARKEEELEKGSTEGWKNLETAIHSEAKYQMVLAAIEDGRIPERQADIVKSRIVSLMPGRDHDRRSRLQSSLSLQEAGGKIIAELENAIIRYNLNGESSPTDRTDQFRSYLRTQLGEDTWVDMEDELGEVSYYGLSGSKKQLIQDAAANIGMSLSEVESQIKNFSRNFREHEWNERAGIE